MKRLPILAAALPLAVLVGMAAAGEPQKTQKNVPDPVQVARGAKAWAENCGRCHNIRDPKEFNDEIWEVSVTHMRIRANLPGKMAEDIKAFLKASNN
ncbi:MAG: hypothetical protein KatS3mg119_1655 [Rhodothalassiaceae bacterium]|nr:MAG: hypothetical protein KatS3mg119_1655 [Rhodothalassiaceae bacterium]